MKIAKYDPEIVRPDHPWELQPGEDTRSHSLFELFRNMGPERSLKEVAECSNIAYQQIAIYSSKFLWQDRAAAYDLHLEQVKLAAIERAAETMAVRQANLGMKLQNVAERRINDYVDNAEMRETLTAQDVSRLAKTGVEIERLARKADTEDTRKGDNTIVFQFGKMPKWAPPELRGDNVKVLQEGDDHADGRAHEENAARPAAEVPRTG